MNNISKLQIFLIKSTCNNLMSSVAAGVLQTQSQAHADFL